MSKKGCCARGLFLRIVNRDLLLAWRQRNEWLHSIVFFIIVISFFPLALGSETGVLERFAPAIFWITAMLANLLAIRNLFMTDYEDGSMDQWLLLPHSLTQIIYAKLLAYWITLLFPFLLITPILSILLQLNWSIAGLLMLTLFLSTPTLVCVGGLGAALTIGLRHNTLLLALITLPLYIPVLIFSTAVIELAQNNLPINAQLSILAAFALLSIGFTPWVMAAALRINA